MSTVRAVRGITPGHLDTDSMTFTPLAPADVEQVGCPDCWAGLTHTGPSFARYHAAANVDAPRTTGRPA